MPTCKLQWSSHWIICIPPGVLRTPDIVKNAPHPLWVQPERSEVIRLGLACIRQIGSEMADLDRHRAVWTGFLGAPGVSTFYVAAGTAANHAIWQFFDANSVFFPASCTITIEDVGDTIDSATGALVGAWSDTTETPVVGTSNASYSGVSGALVRWATATFLSGRRVKGHTFLVPLTDVAYDTGGTITPSAVTGIGAAAATLVASLSTALKIWQRPRLAAPAYTDRRGVTHPAVTARGGGFAPVTTGTCRSVVTELRTRRD